MKLSDIYKNAERQRRELRREHITNWGMIAGAALVLALAVLLSSCTSTLPVSGAGPVHGLKEGRASSSHILGMCFGGDAGVMAAARAGGLDTVCVVDLHTLNILGIYQRHTCIAHGR